MKIFIAYITVEENDDDSSYRIGRSDIVGVYTEATRVNAWPDFWKYFVEYGLVYDASDAAALLATVAEPNDKFQYWLERCYLGGELPSSRDELLEAESIFAVRALDEEEEGPGGRNSDNWRCYLDSTFDLCST